MNIAEWSIKKDVITWVITFILLVVGFVSFNNLARLEDPEFAIKDAVIITPYPGASPLEVELEVTDRLETAIQTMGQVEHVTSISSARPRAPRASTSRAIASSRTSTLSRPMRLSVSWTLDLG